MGQASRSLITLQSKPGERDDAFPLEEALQYGDGKGNRALITWLRNHMGISLHLSADTHPTDWRISKHTQSTIPRLRHRRDCLCNGRARKDHPNASSTG